MDTKITDRPMEVLTEAQTAQVAGGLLIAPNPILGNGCRTCTSGLPILFQSEAASLAK